MSPASPPRPTLSLVAAFRVDITPRTRVDDPDETGQRAIVHEPPTKFGRFARVYALLSDTLGMDAAAREASRVLAARGGR